MNIYRDFILFHELNKCQILQDQHSNNSNYKCLLKTKKLKSEHTVGLTPQNQINTVGMVIETCFHALWVSTWFATSLASLFIILPPALTSHTDLFISKIHSAHFHLRALLLSWAGILIFPFIVWVLPQRSTPPRSLPWLPTSCCHYSMPPVTMALPSFIFFVAVAFNGNDSICFFACLSSVFLLLLKLAESRDSVRLTHPSITNAQKSSNHGSLSINI